MIELYIIIFIGLIIVYIAYDNGNKVCKPTIEYRFIPRTFQEQQENPVKVSDIFIDMFNAPNINPY